MFNLKFYVLFFWIFIWNLVSIWFFLFFVIVVKIGLCVCNNIYKILYLLENENEIKLIKYFFYEINWIY